MAVVLILLLIGLFTDRVLFYQIGIPVLVVNMIIPKIFYPFAILWFGISGLLGDIVSRILLSVIYICIVIPVGFIRKLSGNDSLNLKKFNQSGESVMITRDHSYSASDLEKPF